MKARAGGSLEIDVASAQIDDLLHARSRVVEEENQRPVPRGVSPGGRELREQGGDLVALQETCLGGCGALRWDRGNPLGNREHLGVPNREVLEEGVEQRQALIARPRVVVADLLEVANEAEHALEREVGERQLRYPAPRVLGDEPEEQPDTVAVAAYRRRPQPLHRDEAVEEE